MVGRERRASVAQKDVAEQEEIGEKALVEVRRRGKSQEGREQAWSAVVRVQSGKE